MNPGDIPRIAAPLLTLARESVGKHVRARVRARACVCVCVCVLERLFRRGEDGGIRRFLGALKGMFDPLVKERRRI